MVLLSPSNSDAREDALLSALNAVSDFFTVNYSYVTQDTYTCTILL